METWAQFRENINRPERETGFRLENADFPALNGEQEPEQVEEQSPPPSVEPEPELAVQTTSRISEPDVPRDNFDLRSLPWALRNSPESNKLNSDNLWNNYQALCGLHECRVESTSKQLDGGGVFDTLILGTHIANSCKFASHWEYGTALWPINPQNISSEEGRILEFERVTNNLKNPGIFNGTKNSALKFSYSGDCYELTGKIYSQLERSGDHIDSEEILFFLFYVYGEELMQLLASHRLFKKKWRWNKKYGLWFQIREPIREQPSVSKFYVFQPTEWRKCLVSMEYDPDEFVLTQVIVPPPLETEEIFNELMERTQKMALHERALQSPENPL